MSKGEEKIVNLLQKGRYKFEREKRFKDLKRGLYRFDFYVVCGRAIPCIIELNGAQHYQYVDKFYIEQIQKEEKRTICSLRTL